MEDELLAITGPVTRDAGTAVEIVDRLIHGAVTERASDIHIEPRDREVRVRYRIDGMLQEVAAIPMELHPAVVSRLKILAGMNIAEKRLPQDGRARITIHNREIDLRLATLPTITGEKVAIRILDKTSIHFTLDGLGFTPENLVTYRRMIAQPYGMILVTGPTGSGKTTTLYATLEAVNHTERNIVTIEDPVEYHLAGINQVQVNTRAGLTFAMGLRSLLRQDPDIIMVGEIRDGETADIAVRAALTGHLVFSTLHTNDAAGAVTRLVDMGVAPYLITASLLGVVAQRLVRTLCPACADSPPSLSELPSGQSIASPGGKTGCPRCHHTGYRGRMAIYEIMTVTPAIREHIAARAPAAVLAEVARREGMRTMYEDGLGKVRQGYTTVQEVTRVAYAG